MGLLEKALQYKDAMNKRGTETLIDKIAGPADTGRPEAEQSVSADSRDETSPQADQYNLESADVGSEQADAVTGNMGSVQQEYDDNIYFLTKDDLHEIGPEKVEAETDSVEPAGDHSDNKGNLLNGESDDSEPADGDRHAGQEDEGFNTDEIFPGEDSSPFSDYVILYETVSEVLNAGSFSELTDVILFLAMGQMACSSSSILLHDPVQENSWIISDSRGIKAVTKDISFNAETGFVRELYRERTIIDIDDYQTKSEFSDDYIKFTSIDTRLLVPMLYENEITGILTLGEKISGDEYYLEDLSYLEALGRTAAMALRNISLKNWSYRDIFNIDDKIKKSDRMKNIVQDIYSAVTGEDINSLLKDYLLDYGLTDYVIYIKPETENRFIPFAGIQNGFSDFRQVFVNLDEESLLAKKLYSDGERLEFECKNESPVAEIIKKDYLSRFARAVVFPVHENRLLKGFLCFMESAGKSNVPIDDDIINFVKHPAVNSFLNAYSAESGRYMRTFNAIVEKINREISRAESVSIPLSLVMFTIKNFKRLFRSLGTDSADEFFAGMENLVEKRISDGDSFFRYDKNRLLIILPGKDKKFASALASGIRNELSSCWPDPEGSPLVTILISQFPDDSDNAYSLLDIIE